MKDENIIVDEKLTEHDILTICNNIDLEILLEPIKKNNKKYRKHQTKIGRLDKKSEFLKKKLPKLVVHLYNENDEIYVNIITKALSNFRCIFDEWVKENDIDIYQISTYSCEKIIKMIECNKKGNFVDFDINLFLLQLKLSSVSLDEDIKVELMVKYSLNKEISKIERDNISKIENLKREVEKFKNNNEKLTFDLKEYKKICKDKKILEKELETLKINSIKRENDYRKSKEKINILNEHIIMDNALIEKLKLENSINNIELEKLVNENNQNILKISKLKNQISCIQKAFAEIKNKYSGLETEYLKVTSDMKIVNETNSKLWFLNSFDNGNGKEDKNRKIMETQLFSNNPLVEDGFSSDCQKFQCFEEFMDLVEDNFSNAGIRDKNNIVYNFFSSIEIGLIPLLVGFRAIDIAKVLIASKFNEGSTIISIPPGFNDIISLKKVIDSTETKTVIIADALGKMSDELYLPIIRNCNDKILVFTLEDKISLQYIESYFYNYFNLIIVDEMCNCLKKCDKISYGSYTFDEKISDCESHKIYHMKNKIYSCTRNSLINCMNKMLQLNEEENEINDKAIYDLSLDLFKTEQKILFSREDCEKLVSEHELNGFYNIDKFRKELKENEQFN